MLNLNGNPIPRRKLRFLAKHPSPALNHPTSQVWKRAKDYNPDGTYQIIPKLIHMDTVHAFHKRQIGNLDSLPLAAREYLKQTGASEHNLPKSLRKPSKLETLL